MICRVHSDPIVDEPRQEFVLNNFYLSTFGILDFFCQLGYLKSVTLGFEVCSYEIIGYGIELRQLVGIDDRWIEDANSSICKQQIKNSIPLTTRIAYPRRNLSRG